MKMKALIISKPEVALLFLRASLGVLLLLHGIGKLMDLLNGNTAFFDDFDPFGVGSLTMLYAAVFAEFFCPVLIILGWFTRLALVPVISTLSVAFFVFHATDDFLDKELPLVYLIGFIFLFLTGPGKLSIDNWTKPHN
ncbi:MAG: DoxX family protein [Cyclobacteriaceae bacterium]|nr:DoxX family protein [Flammeovirgaceae bacterium]MCO5272195.1 DoxX family protein [Cyclobacteriaceae bacterium]